MNQAPNQQNPTPNRRRQGRSSGRNPAQKSYASENDAGAPVAAQYDMTPQTPEKGSASKRGRVTSAKQNTQSNRTKAARQSNVSGASPETDQPVHRSTPSQSGSMRGSNSIAFAGGSFHASPAPSALPMPSFLSKAPATAVESPASRAGEMGALPQQPSPSAAATARDVPTPQQRPAGGAVNGSPLDFMFKAHREERQRQAGEHSTSHASTPPVDSPFGPASYPRAASSGPHSRPAPSAFRQGPAGRLDDDELGGGYGQAVGPSFSTPYQDRIRAARPTQSPQQRTPAQQAAGDPSEELKKFLFSGNPQSPSAASNNAAPQPHNLLGGAQPSPPPAHLAGQGFAASPQGNNLQAMENDLRRILKLDTGSSTNTTERRLFGP